jgi:hypothetical protein
VYGWCLGYVVCLGKIDLPMNPSWIKLCKALIPCDKLKENKMMKKELLHEGLGNLLVFFLK